ncbi:MAG TPA: polysaccharide deacetylase family protein [Candidatus Dormibacteraeota bacterium]|nr:polysaccharide deacetylase family protein [Candidatus Dormibacteraeota bacterium]
MVRVRGIARVVLSAALLAGLATALVGPVQAVTVRVVSNGSRAQPLVALTFDDGVSPENCRRILAILVAQGVPATFFPIAEAMPLDPAFWRLLAQAGYPIGDHTLSHPELPTLTRAAQYAQIDKGRAVAESIIGRPILRVFRPPYGAYDADTIAATGGAGFGTLLLWDVSDRDTSLHGTVAQMLAAGEAGQNGSVVLMHCGPNATPYLLGDLIASYRSRGFRFVTIPELLGVPWSPGVTSTVSPAAILGGLSPLPTSPRGGVVTGPNGYTPSPTPIASASPRASSSPSPVPSPSSSPAPSEAASPSSSPSPSPSASPTPVPSVTPPVAPSGSGLDPAAAFMSALGVSALVLLALASVAVSARRRSRRPTRPPTA